MMTKRIHRCDKEVEITEMHSDIKYIRKALDGNGQKGLIKSVQENSDFRVGFESNIKFMQILFGSGIIFSIIAIVISLIG